MATVRVLKNKCRFLHLPMKKQWFDMVASGEKKQEYRLVSPHWGCRIGTFMATCEEVGNKAVVCFKNGYQTDAPTHYRELLMVMKRDKSIHPEWGEDEYNGIEHYVLYLGDELRFDSKESL